MYGYEPSWVDIYMNAMANQQQMMPLTSINTQMPVVPIEQSIPQNVQPDQNIMVGNEQNQTVPIDNSMSSLSDLSSNGVMNNG